MKKFLLLPAVFASFLFLVHCSQVQDNAAQNTGNSSSGSSSSSSSSHGIIIQFNTTNDYFEDFNDGDASNWTVYDGTWAVSNNICTVAPYDGAKLKADGTDFTNFSAEMDISVGASGNAGFLVRANNFTNGTDMLSGYYIGIDSSSYHLQMGKMNNSWTELKLVSTPIVTGRVYHMKVEAYGSSIKVYIDNMTNAKMEVIDTSYTSGSIGIRTYQASAAFDNIAVKRVLSVSNY
jgi:hypothetical protein